MLDYRGRRQFTLAEGTEQVSPFKKQTINLHFWKWNKHTSLRHQVQAVTRVKQSARKTSEMNFIH